MTGSSYIRRMPLTPSISGTKGRLITRLDMELTERCNNDCVHCYINRPADDPSINQELAFDKIQTILEEALCLGCQNIRFTGGEPLLREDFEQIYVYAKKLGLRVEIFTNGTRLTPQLARILSRFPAGHPLQISLYGKDQKTYESISRTPDSYKAVLKGIDLLTTYKIPFVINPVLLPLSKGTFLAFEAWAESRKDLNILKPQVTTLHLRCRGRDVQRNEEIKTFRIAPSLQLELESRDQRAQIDGLKAFCSRFCQVHGTALFRCNAGINKGCADAYGKLQMCLLLRHPDTVYDLGKGSLHDAFRQFFPKVRQLEAQDKLYHERCAHCFLVDLCEQCPAVSWMEERKLDGWLEHFCRLTHAQARLIGLLAEGEKSWMVADWQHRVKDLQRPSLTTRQPASAQV